MTSQPLLSARDLTRQYGGRNGCRNVSFDLYPGEVLCIVGESGSGKRRCSTRAAALLARLNVPQRLWTLAPATFSGGEQQRVNIARGLIAGHPLLLLDEPTASLDAENRDVVAELIVEACERGAAIFGIFHDEETRSKVATRRLALQPSRRH
ncbi:Vitamin B12 import ATP-binding protein BtuD [Paraburkholderia fynbosensis]|uniref:Vitamin B12 import ATP-binding protein BtuD n=1 Tax=Paraburkholderia fynbosensis TaxID=1200993 RepID=A0A6J5G1B1_9BURK|nr:Vitamin B12 import ATP-binding protein BtuD [Paraburkholderia fynbosensis]